MKEFDQLAKITQKLRGKNGCPWDKVQTHKSLKPFVIEEAYETNEAIDKKNAQLLKGELGDLLLQVMLHAQIAKENKEFTIKDVINSISEKMIRRHPHVFKNKQSLAMARLHKIDSKINNVWQNWEEIKKTEKDSGKSILDSIPKALPALYKAEKSQKKAARVGFDWDSVAGAWDKVHEELEEINELLRKKKKNKMRLDEEIGDLLFSVVNVARKLDIDAEESLQNATKKFSRRFRFIEDQAKKMKKQLKDMSLAQMDTIWNEAKKKV